MVLCIAVVALVNLGLGFALAIHLARQHRSSMAISTASPTLDSDVKDRPLRSRSGSDTATVGVPDLQAQVRQYNDQLTDLESRVQSSNGSRR